MPAPLFEFFEVVAEELSATTSKVITGEDLRTGDEDGPLLEDLIREIRAANKEDAIRCAVQQLTQHFEARGAKLPFEYAQETGRFTATDFEFLSFVNEMRDIRSISKRSRDFECRVAQRLGQRVTGALHRVGHPRDKKKTKEACNEHLKKLGFGCSVLRGSDKDGGLDVLWLLPVGAIPHRPIVSVQCKNGEFNMDEADESVGKGSRSLALHSGLQAVVHVPCVLFNDYMHSGILAQKPLNFVPLGLTDLALLEQKISVELI